MLAGVGAAVAQAGVQQLRPRWQTRMSQCSRPAECDEWFASFVCLPCVAAAAKSKVDNSNPCYNFLCWQPVGSYSFIRHAYGIDGSCGDDCGYGIFCAPCAVRQTYTESRLKGFVGGAAGSGLQEWHVSLFDCDCCEFFNALLCPMCAAGEVRGMLQPTSAPDCCFNTWCILPTAVYGQTRHTYGIITDCGPLEDLCIPLFCFPCSIIRAKREVQWQYAHLNATQVVGAVQAVAAGVMHGGAAPAAAAPMGQQQQYGHQQQYGQPQQQGYPQQQQQYPPQQQQQQQQQQQKKPGPLQGILGVKL